MRGRKKVRATSCQLSQIPSLLHTEWGDWFSMLVNGVTARDGLGVQAPELNELKGFLEIPMQRSPQECFP